MERARERQWYSIEIRTLIGEHNWLAVTIAH